MCFFANWICHLIIITIVNVICEWQFLKWLSVIMSCSALETSTHQQHQLITNVSPIPTQLLLEVDIRIYVNPGDGSTGCNILGGTMEQFCYNNNNCYNNLSITSLHHELRQPFTTCYLPLLPPHAPIWNSLEGGISAPAVHFDFKMLLTLVWGLQIVFDH